MNGAFMAALPAKTIATVPVIQTPGARMRAEFERYFRETKSFSLLPWKIGFTSPTAPSCVPSSRHWTPSIRKTESWELP